MKIKEDIRVVAVPTCATDAYGVALMTSRIGSGIPAEVEVAVVRLRADEGKFLTQSGDVGLLDRVVTDGDVLLGRGDCAGNWREIDGAEAEALLAEQARAQEAAEAEMMREAMGER